MDLERYGRQMLVTGAGGQAEVSKLRVLVVGAGGLGCSCLAYLVGAGVSAVTICDADVVEVSNLHRQPLHTEAGALAREKKVESAARALRALNPNVEIRAVSKRAGFDDATADLVKSHDVVADCSDNVGTRYLLNDLCFLAGKSLYSASALGREGSLSTYHWLSCCYRCAHPRPATIEAKRSCADRGVLGPVPGALGALQALEILTRAPDDDIAVFDGRELRRFRKPPKRPNCQLCGVAATIRSVQDSKDSCAAMGLVVVEGAGFGTIAPAPPPPLPEDAVATCADLARALSRNGAVVLDVRDPNQFSMCSLPGSVSVPIADIIATNGDAVLEKLPLDEPNKSIFVLCRRGVDSRLATSALRAHSALRERVCRHVEGGLQAWRATVDPAFPAY
ncbi:hypothetical protein CTAYLR_002504 [Chrysophaeum taylorii]|uniref:Rhodanese domain-containing protein n=1 Tax=Chrysophaeum taylorii TaxID=2483200 RepID=A0AAD7UF68_9STRA|nr:hypothetical protein CTAYLR_002504 [Chrysophaeum taylorii]